MYESFFSLRHRPFLAAPDVYHYYPSTIAEQARSSLIRCIERGQGPALVIGPAGTGKSLLCQMIAEHFRAALNVALLAHSGVCTRRALFQSILFALRQRHRGSSEGELRLTMLNYLESTTECPQGALLIVDEAHTLPIRLLEELRILTNFCRDGQSRLRLVLAGGPSLEERFTDPKLESFQQRIGVRCYLQALNRDETGQYVHALVASADGLPDEVFDAGALRAIYHATDGVPRLINQLCDAALLVAAKQGRRPVDAQIIEQAWAESQQLPTPWQTPDESASRSPAAATSIIEFGQLRDDSVTTASFELPPMESATHVAEPEWAATTPFDAQETPTEVAATPVPTEPLVAANPFGEGFDDEEVVIDRYASLDTNVTRLRIRVSCEEGRAWAAALRAASHLEEAPVATQAVAEPSSTQHVNEDSDHDEDSNVVLHHVVQEEQLDEGEDTQDEVELRGTLPLDDRDLLIVEDEGGSHRARERDAEHGRARRQEYRQLFAQLRRRP